MDTTRDNLLAQRLKRQKTYLQHRGAVERQKLEKELRKIKVQLKKKKETMSKSMRRVEEEIWRRDAEEEATDSDDDVGVIDGIYVDEPDESLDMPDEAAALSSRLSAVSFSRPSTSIGLERSLPSSRSSNSYERTWQHRPVSSSGSISRSFMPSSCESRNSFSRSEYLAIPKRFSAKLSPSLNKDGSMNSDVIILGPSQKILTYRIFIPRGDEELTVASYPVSNRSKRKLLFAREARAKSAPPVCTWNRFLQNARSRSSSSHICKYDMTTKRCVNYPCVAPMEYNSLGFDIDHNRENRFKTANQLSTRARQRLIKHLENESVRRSLRSSVEQTANREKALEMFMWQMKTRTETGKPRDWATNYGAPVSRRKVLSATPSHA